MLINKFILNTLEGKINSKKEIRRLRDIVLKNSREKLALPNYLSIKKLTRKIEDCGSSDETKPVNKK